MSSLYKLYPCMCLIGYEGLEPVLATKTSFKEDLYVYCTC